MQRFLKVVRNAKISQSDEKCEDFLKVMTDANIFRSGFVVMGNRPKMEVFEKYKDFFKKKMRRFFKVVRNTKISQNGENFGGDEKCKDFSK